MRALVGFLSLPLLLLAACFPQRVDGQNIVTPVGKQGRPQLQEYVEEFFLSDAVRNQGKGELQLSLGVDSRQKIGTSTSLKTEYGITRRLQLSVEVHMA
jgi:hypothetical protein